MKILSYCFFTPLQLPSHRSWDEYRNDIERYYYNIPTVLLMNRILYPDYRTRVYITDNTQGQPLMDIFNKLKDNSLEIVIVNMEYKLTEPSILRMIPLWEEGFIEIFHTRDIDSIPTEIEYRYTRAFENHFCGIGTLRTHQNHYGHGCKMLAGLSSFKPSLVPEYIKGDSFQSYYDSGHKNYGCDQDLMIKTFTTNSVFTMTNFYDCKAYRQNNSQDFPCISCSQEELDNIIIEPDKLELFSMVKECGFDNWAGEPIDIRGKFSDFVLSKFPDVKSKIESNPLLKDFYRL